MLELPLPEFEEAVLVRSDLVEVEVVVAGLDVLAPQTISSDPAFQIAAARKCSSFRSYANRERCSRPTRASKRSVHVPSKSANVKNEKQYEALKDKGMSKQRAARIANSPGASKRGGKKSGSGGSSKQGGTTAQHKAAGRKGGKATAKKR
jgi:hypothetical protein